MTARVDLFISPGAETIQQLELERLHAEVSSPSWPTRLKPAEVSSQTQTAHPLRAAASPQLTPVKEKTPEIFINSMHFSVGQIEGDTDRLLTIISI